VVRPGIDLHLDRLQPADPAPSTSGTYEVGTVLTGLREGDVRLDVSGGATVVGSSCQVSGGTEVTCATPTEGQQVSLTLRPDEPALGTPVTVTAEAADAFVELQPEDNQAGTTLTPDVSLDSVTLVGNDDQDLQAAVRADVSGVPTGVTTVRLGLSGDLVGLDAGQVHLTGGDAGAVAGAPVTCTTTSADGSPAADGVWATCTGVAGAPDGRFSVTMQVAHPSGTASDVTFSVLPLGVDEGSHTGNDARTLTIG
jgi:hypothetical protein